MGTNMHIPRWPLRPLAEVAEINPKRPPELRTLDESTPVSFVPMAAVCEKAGAIKEAISRPFGEVRKGFTYFAEGDVIFAKITPCMQNGKTAVALGLVNGLGFGSTEFHVLRPTRAAADWLYFFIRTKSFRDEAQRHFQGSAGQQRVPEDFMRQVLIPDAPVKDQRRVVSRIKECLSRVEEMERLREEAEAEAELLFDCYIQDRYASLCQQFGTRPLHELAKPCGGGTPDRKRADFWNGSLPWVSPKDMKRWEIDSAQETISSTALDNSAAKLIQPPTVLFVVRGMILIHTLPVAISKVPLAINQDMKALVPTGPASAEFLAFMMRGASRLLLEQVEIAGHGTRRLQTEKWINLPIPQVGELEASFVAQFQATRRRAAELISHLAHDDLTHLRESVLREAFAGNL